MLSLRFRVLLGAVLWTVGLVLFSFGFISWVFRTHPDMPVFGRRGQIHDSPRVINRYYVLESH